MNWYKYARSNPIVLDDFIRQKLKNIARTIYQEIVTAKFVLAGNEASYEEYETVIRLHEGEALYCGQIELKDLKGNNNHAEYFLSYLPELAGIGFHHRSEDANSFIVINFAKCNQINLNALYGTLYHETIHALDPKTIVNQRNLQKHKPVDPMLDYEGYLNNEVEFDSFTSTLTMELESVYNTIKNENPSASELFIQDFEKALRTGEYGYFVNYFNLYGYQKNHLIIADKIKSDNFKYKKLIQRLYQCLEKIKNNYSKS